MPKLPVCLIEFSLIYTGQYESIMCRERAGEVLCRRGGGGRGEHACRGSLNGVGAMIVACRSGERRGVERGGGIQHELLMTQETWMYQMYSYIGDGIGESLPTKSHHSLKRRVVDRSKAPIG